MNSLNHHIPVPTSASVFKPACEIFCSNKHVLTNFILLKLRLLPFFKNSQKKTNYCFIEFFKNFKHLYKKPCFKLCAKQSYNYKNLIFLFFQNILLIFKNCISIIFLCSLLPSFGKEKILNSEILVIWALKWLIWSHKFPK